MLARPDSEIESVGRVLELEVDGEIGAAGDTPAKNSPYFFLAIWPEDLAGLAPKYLLQKITYEREIRSQTCARFTRHSSL